MKVPVAWFRTQSSWDGAFPRYILAHATEGKVGEFFVTPQSIRDFPAFAPRHDLCVFVIPGQHSLNDYDLLNEAAGDLEKVVFIVNGDEEALFRADKLEHPNKKVWWFAPPLDQKVDRVAPFGWPVGAPEMLAEMKSEERDIPWSFAGQLTHQNRQECWMASWALTKEGTFIGTEGFSQGLPRQQYYRLMARSKFVLCPSGPHTQDSFRFAEALEAQCIPIVKKHPYWNYVFGSLPFPVVDRWIDLPDMFDSLLKNYEDIKATCDFWWGLKKKEFIAQMREDLT